MLMQLHTTPVLLCSHPPTLQSVQEICQIPSYYNQHKWHLFMYFPAGDKGHFKSCMLRFSRVEATITLTHTDIVSHWQYLMVFFCPWDFDVPPPLRMKMSMNQAENENAFHASVGVDGGEYRER